MWNTGRRLAILLPVAAVHAFLLSCIFSAREEAVHNTGVQSENAMPGGKSAVLTISGATSGQSTSRSMLPSGHQSQNSEAAPEQEHTEKTRHAAAVSRSDDAKSENNAKITVKPGADLQHRKHAAAERKNDGHAAPEQRPGRSMKKRAYSESQAKTSGNGRPARSSRKSPVSEKAAGTSDTGGKAPAGKSGISSSASDISATSGGDMSGVNSGAGGRHGKSYRMFGVSSSGVIVSCSTVLRYPEKSRRRGSEGRVKARVQAAPDGRVLKAEAAESSGDWYLDSALTDFISKCMFKSGGVYDVEADFRLK